MSYLNDFSVIFAAILTVKSLDVRSSMIQNSVHCLKRWYTALLRENSLTSEIPDCWANQGLIVTLSNKDLSTRVVHLLQNQDKSSLQTMSKFSTCSENRNNEAIYEQLVYYFGEDTLSGR